MLGYMLLTLAATVPGWFVQSRALPTETILNKRTKPSAAENNLVSFRLER
jgi:hypothetical protein